MPKDYVPGSSGFPDQPPAAEGVGERRPDSGRDAPTTGYEPGPVQPDAAEGDDIGHGTRDPAGTSGGNDVKVPVRPGGGGNVYDSDADELPHRRDRDVQAHGSFEPDLRHERGAYRSGTVPERGDDEED